MRDEMLIKCYEKSKELNAEFNENGMVLRNGELKGVVTKWEPNYLEIEILDSNDERIFYQQIEDRKELENEIADVLNNFYITLYKVEKEDKVAKLSDEPYLYNFNDGRGPRLPKILITCSCGGSSYIYADLLKRKLKQHGLDFEIDALDIDTALERIDEYDGVMLAPQVSYYYDDLRNKYGLKIKKIPSSNFSRMDTSIIESKLLKEEK